MEMYTVKIKAESCERPRTVEYDRVYGVYTTLEAAEAAIYELAGGERNVSVVFDSYSWIHAHDDPWGDEVERYFIEALVQCWEL